ncbi:uncharacterized protein LOC117300893 [Asterias rubens]|uniref:uncharacterized protein LOC117300893 n=1 Tax=Asterias rubens TaxID=7604 RepID=UPI001455829C|nr:uncharacterized protein LOC117300893 [Asterias rubens]
MASYKQRQANIDNFFKGGAQRSRPVIRNLPVIRNQYSAGHGMPMGAYRGTSVSSASYPSRDATCNLYVCMRAVSVCVLVCGALMLACGLFLYPGTFLLGLCIPGGIMIVIVLLVWCIMYVWGGTYCKSEGSSDGCRGTSYRPAATSGDEVTVDVQLSQSAPGDVMCSYGPDTRITESNSVAPPPIYNPVNVSGSFPVSGRNSSHSPSTPPPPYNEVTF